jgi:uncharacterized protein YlzI (FlbEa/FlbD family)
MPCKATTALIALFVFGFPSVVLADINNRAGHHHLFVQRPVATMSNGHIRAVNDAAKPLTAEEGASFTAFCRGGGSGRTKPWIKLTGPGGEPVHINVEQITSVKSDTESSGATTQLDLASGKFQRVKENVEQVMQLIFAFSDARENEETPSAGLICVGSIDRLLPRRAGL